MRAIHQLSKVACVVAMLSFALPFTSSLTSRVTAGQAYCAAGTCVIEMGAMCWGDGQVKYNARYEPL